MGVFEQAPSEAGTRAVWQARDVRRDAAQGRLLPRAVRHPGQVHRQGDLFAVLGVELRFLTGEELPVVKALRHGAGLCEN